MKPRQSLLSKSAIINIHQNYGSEFMKAYLFVRLLAAQYKHPIILDYTTKLDAIRHVLGMRKQDFNSRIKTALRLVLIKIEGNHLRLLSNTQDRKDFKRSKKNDYRRTNNPTKFKNMVLLLHNDRAKDKLIASKVQPSLEERNNSERVNQLVRPYNNQIANNNKIASCRSVSKALGLNSTSAAHKVLNDFHEEGLITLTKHKQQISKGVFRALKEKGCHNIRYDKQAKEYYVVFASTIKLNYNLKRTKKTPFQKMTRQQRIAALEMGWTEEMINQRG